MIETDQPTTASNEPSSATEGDLAKTAREVGAAAQQKLGDVRDAALSSMDEAKATAAAKADDVKDQAAGEIARTARGLEAAAEEMEGAPFQQDLLREAADGLKQIAQAVEGKSLGALAGELSEFGRRNPAAYLGGAALVGFALARFARASAPAGAGVASGRVGSGQHAPVQSGSSGQLGSERSSAELTGGNDHG